MHIQLTNGGVALVDAEWFEELNQFKWHQSRGYAVRYVPYSTTKILMHRVVNKTPDRMETDHKNQNRLDNRTTNLRSCTKSQNAMNRGKRADNTSGYKGVTWHKRNRSWYASVYADGRRVHLGSFKDKLEAAKAVEDNIAKYHGKFARI
jgi:hypothetical protein